MKLYSAGTSPFARKVRVCLHELGMMDQVEIIPVVGTPLAPSDLLVGKNPLSKIPCLVIDDGRAIYDSRIITRYLNDLGKGSLYPNDDTLWDMLTLEATAEGMMEAALNITYENVLRPADIQMDTWKDWQWNKFTQGSDMIMSRWATQLTGPLDMAQIAVGCALGYADLRHDARSWRDGRSELAAWLETFSKRGSMQKTDPTL